MERHLMGLRLAHIALSARQVVFLGYILILGYPRNALDNPPQGQR